MAAEHEEHGKKTVEHEIDATDKGGELRPGKREEPLVGVAPFPCLGVELKKFDLARADRDWMIPPFHGASVTIFSRLRERRGTRSNDTKDPLRKATALEASRCRWLRNDIIFPSKRE